MTDSSRTREHLEPRAFYFGTHDGAGHYLWDRALRKLRPSYDDFAAGRGYTVFGLPWLKIDGKLNPSERQGEAALHHLDGWTALAFANRTDDRRPGSNSAFFFDAVLTFEGALAAAREHFPRVIERFKFEIYDTADRAPQTVAPDA